MTKFDFSTDKYPTITEFTKSDAYIRGIIGPAGSAKTTYAFKELVLRSILQEPSPLDNVRYTKWFIIRNTFRQLRDNTIASYKTALGPLFQENSLREHPTPKATLELSLADGSRVHAQFIFVAIDTPKAISDLLGAEMTGVMIDEASEISQAAVTAALNRISRYPSRATVPNGPTWSGMILTTNGPKKNHWLHSWHTTPRKEWQAFEESSGRKYFELFCQPPALLRPTNPGEPWRENPLAENIHNLQEGYSYYFKMLGNDPDSIIAYVEGKFADLKSGKVVFPEFNSRLHVIDERQVIVPRGAPIIMSFDFGRTPVCLIAICNEYGTLFVIDEIVGESMSIDTLYTSKIKPVYKTDYPASEVVLAYGDPAGNDETQAIDISPFQVLRAHGIPIEVSWNTRNELHSRLEAVRVRLTKLAKNSKPMLMISTKCKLLIEALTTTYIYPEARQHGVDITKESPTKSHINWVSDLADALQYLCLGFDSTHATSPNDKRIRPNQKARRSLLR